jgi:hypothetical protein
VGRTNCKLSLVKKNTFFQLGVLFRSADISPFVCLDLSLMSFSLQCPNKNSATWRMREEEKKRVVREQVERTS